MWGFFDIEQVKVSYRKFLKNILNAHSNASSCIVHEGGNGAQSRHPYSVLAQSRVPIVNLGSFRFPYKNYMVNPVIPIAI